MASQLILSQKHAITALEQAGVSHSGWVMGRLNMTLKICLASEGFVALRARKPMVDVGRAVGGGSR